MANILKINCNGANGHLNEVNLDQVLQETPIYRDLSVLGSWEYPERVLINCRVCTEGQVVITREILQDFFGNK